MMRNGKKKTRRTKKEKISLVICILFFDLNLFYEDFIKSKYFIIYKKNCYMPELQYKIYKMYMCR